MSRASDESVLKGLLACERDRATASPVLRLLETGERQLQDLTKEEREAFSGVPLVELVLARSWACRHHDPQRMVLLAKTAKVLADNLSVRRYGRKVVADFRARAWAELGNAHRVGNQLEAAESAVRRAAAYAGEGTGDPALNARILDIWATLLKDSRTFSEAISVLEELIFYYRRLEDPESLGKMLVALGQVYEQANEPERAVGVLLEALQRIAPGGPLVLAAINGLTVNLAGAGDYESARGLLQKTRRLYRRSGKMNELRLLWLEGKIAFGLGEWGGAEAKLNTARLAFKHANLSYDSALVSLDLALVYARQERHGELIWLVDDMCQVFRTLKIAQELIASLLLLRKSCSKEVSGEILCAQIETISVTLAELRGRERWKKIA